MLKCRTKLSPGRALQSERVINRRKDGSLYTEEIAVTPVIYLRRGDQPGHLTHFIAIKQNVTEREQDKNRQAAIAGLFSLTFGSQWLDFIQIVNPEL